MREPWDLGAEVAAEMAPIGRAVVAKFSGVCALCTARIRPGDRIIPFGGGGSPFSLQRGWGCRACSKAAATRALTASGEGED